MDKENIVNLEDFRINKLLNDEEFMAEYIANDTIWVDMNSNICERFTKLFRKDRMKRLF